MGTRNQRLDNLQKTSFESNQPIFSVMAAAKPPSDMRDYGQAVRYMVARQEKPQHAFVETALEIVIKAPRTELLNIPRAILLASMLNLQGTLRSIDFLDNLTAPGPPDPYNFGTSPALEPKSFEATRRRELLHRSPSMTLPTMLSGEEREVNDGVLELGPSGPFDAMTPPEEEHKGSDLICSDICGDGTS